MSPGIISKHTPMLPVRRSTLVAGIFYLLTFISIPTLALYQPIRHFDWVTGNGPDNVVAIGAILEIVVALAGVGTAVALYPILKKHNEGIALGLVASRILEAGTMFIGVSFLLSIVTLRQAGAGKDALITSQALVALYDRVFLVGQSFFPAINALLLGYMLYQLRLVPKILPLIGITGAVLLLSAGTAILFGFIEQRSPSTSLAAIPIAFWEFSLGLWLIIKGFKNHP